MKFEKMFHEKLTRLAKNIFGEEIVKGAYLVRYCTFVNQDYAKQVLAWESTDVDRYIDDNPHVSTAIDISGNDRIVGIEFINGKFVVFSATEFGEIELVES